jgi:hypothetical protein
LSTKRRWPILFFIDTTLEDIMNQRARKARPYSLVNVKETEMNTVAGIRIPDSIMARAATELVRDTQPDLLYNLSRRVFLFGALAAERKQLGYDPELLYIGAMFHDMGLMNAYSSKTNRFEVDGANAARLPDPVRSDRIRY